MSQNFLGSKYDELQGIKNQQKGRAKRHTYRPFLRDVTRRSPRAHGWIAPVHPSPDSPFHARHRRWLCKRMQASHFHASHLRVHIEHFLHNLWAQNQLEYVARKSKNEPMQKNWSVVLWELRRGCFCSDQEAAACSISPVIKSFLLFL